MAHDAHAHPHDHDHDHGGLDHSGHHNHAHDVSSESRIALAAALTGLFMGAEVVGGILSGSLALIADAGHMLSDFGSLVLAWFGFRIARRPADARRTYGFRRFTVLAAFTNGLTLFAVAAWIIYEAAMRILSPHPVLAGPMLVIAVVGLLVNIAAFVILHGADRESLNVRGALLHVLGDLLGSVAAIAAALIIMATGWTAADPILSVLVALLLLRSAWMLTRESGHILLEGAPRHLDVDAVAADIAAHVDGVLDVHHAHAWSLDERQPLMTMHARIAADRAPADIVAAIKQRLADKHKVKHATVEIEWDACASPSC